MAFGVVVFGVLVCDLVVFFVFFAGPSFQCPKTISESPDLLDYAAADRNQIFCFFSTSHHFILSRNKSLFKPTAEKKTDFAV